MSAPVLAFRNRNIPPRPRRRKDGKSVDRIAAKLQRIHDHDPELTSIVENLIDEVLADCVRFNRTIGGDGEGA